MKHMNFRTKLLMYIIPTTIIGIAILMVLTYTMSSSRIVTVLGENMQAGVEQTRRELDSWLTEREREATILASTDLVRAACHGERLDEAETFLKTYFSLSPQLENLFVSSTAGVTIVDGVGGSSVGLDLTGLDEYRKNVDMTITGKNWMSDVQASPVSGRPVVLLTVPVTENDRVIGMIGAPFELMQFSSTFITGSSEETATTYMLDGTGKMLAHPNTANILTVDVTESEYGRDILTRKNGHFTYTDNGVEMITYFVTHPESGWIIAASESLDNELASVRSLKKYSAGASILLVGIILVIIWLTTTRVFTTIHRTTAGLTEASCQLSSASGQVSSSSQNLSGHASEQAGSIEETSASLNEISSMAKRNADNAAQCDNAMKEVDDSFRRIDINLGKLIDAVNDINQNSLDTQRIIKTIDEIAFQTNLLALNAAVEAARAGEAGLGFAVVAEEVRNLSQRAAEAARDTQVLIEKTVGSVKNGTALMDGVQEVIAENREIGGRVAALVSEIAMASTEQAQGIQQVNTAVSQLDMLTQSIAANAEEAASTSEELSAQANDMDVYINSLAMLIGSSGSGMSAGAALTPESHTPGQPVRHLSAGQRHRSGKEDSFIMEDRSR